MCPLCIGTATLIVSGGASAGGLAAVVLKRLGRKQRQELCDADTGQHRNSYRAARHSWLRRRTRL